MNKKMNYFKKVIWAVVMLSVFSFGHLSLAGEKAPANDSQEKTIFDLILLNSGTNDAGSETGTN